MDQSIDRNHRRPPSVDQFNRTKIETKQPQDITTHSPAKLSLNSSIARTPEWALHEEHHIATHPLLTNKLDARQNSKPAKAGVVGRGAHRV